MKDFNKISDFIDGTLSSAEQAEFEQSIKNNPELKANVNRQKMLIEGIKAARHSELKTRLAAIPVVTGIAMRTKIAVGVAAVFTAGLTLFGYQELTKAPVNTTTTIKQTTVSPQQTTVTETITITPEKTIEELAPIEEPVIEAPKSNPTVSNITTTRNQINTNNTKEVIINTPKTNFDIPLNPNEAGIKRPDGSQHKDNLSGNKTVTKTMILPKIEKSKTLQYLYDNNNLTLYGDFSAEEYLVLDYRHIDKVFLYFNNSFYELKVQKRKSTLESSLVTDPNLKAQLRAELQD